MTARSCVRIILIGDGNISKQFECQRFVFKIHSTRLRRAKWNLTLGISDARKNDELISLASSQVLRWIDELNGVEGADERARLIKQEIKRIRSEAHSNANAKAIRRLYSELDSLQFKPDYMCLIVDKNSDYIRACKGFSINGVRYTRLLGTPGGIKMSTIIFVSERVAPEIRRRIDNDRNMEKAFIPAKLEAYRALTCSASTPLSSPSGVLVVNDVESTFDDVVINLSNSGGGEPTVSEPHTEQISIVASDGCGMMLPRLAERWSADLNLSYTMSGCCIRMAWTKGMVYAFPFDEFAEEVAGRYIVKDVWGDDVDIRGVELILPISMVKLWDSYGSCAEWLGAATRNGYTFAATKVCIEKLESERTCNYQFLQCIDMDDDDIAELVEPTVTEIKDVLGGDWAKTVLYLKGINLTANNVTRIEDDWQKALMIEPSLINDPFIKSSIFNLIKCRINDAKVGVIKVHGNYSTACGDLYALCQSMFGLPVTGLLKAGEIYNHYWANSDATELLAFRAPMSCAENIKRVTVARGEDVLKWYRYMLSCTVINAHDSMMCALNGMDFDGDLVMLTDNPVLLRRQKRLPTLMCEQKKGEKKIPTEDDFIRSNIASFGNEVGQITNKGTSMYEVRSKFDPSSDEYKTLEYRIRCTQAYQQDSIDKAKGIVSDPMPRSWYDRHAISADSDDDEKALYRSVLADKKPYFMKYIYPALSRQHSKYIKAVGKNAIREFGVSMDELLSKPISDLNESQIEFIRKYKKYMPVGTGNCVMNRICRKVEQEFSGQAKYSAGVTGFDASSLKTESDYSMYHFNTVKRLIAQYDNELKAREVDASYQRKTGDEKRAELALMDSWFIEECSKACPDSDELCNIVVDICYGREKTKSFAWKVCGDTIVKNLLRKNGKISFPTLNEEGSIEWKSKRFSVEYIEMGVNN